jgi:CheY-like chemotaxis protein
MTLKGMVRKLGYRVETANNGEEAVQQCRQLMFDMVLMDCQMPIMDGFEAARQIRALDNDNAQVPIIAVTANAMSQDRENCLAAGMNDYLKKPVSKAQLQACMAPYLAPSSQAAV